MILQKGIGLLEITVVLMVAALIVFGVMTGLGMRDNADIQNIIAQINEQRTAVNSFQQQFGALPGDSSDASDFLAGAAEGNGDGFIRWASGEGTLAWRHLQLANLVRGTFTGAGTTAIIGTNVPAANNGMNAGFSLDFDDTAPSTTNMNVHVIRFGAVSAGSYTSAPALNVQQALQIDRKADDGFPLSGSIQRTTQSNATCTAATTPVSYNATTANEGALTVLCALNFAL
jgi:hypothetical protein